MKFDVRFYLVPSCLSFFDLEITPSLFPWAVGGFFFGWGGGTMSAVTGWLPWAFSLLILVIRPFVYDGEGALEWDKRTGWHNPFATGDEGRDLSAGIATFRCWRRASSQPAADALINGPDGSMWPLTFGLACCAVEMVQFGCLALRH